MLNITSEERRALRARAHSLNPVVAIAENGLSDTVLKEIDNCLKAHELIKVRVFNDERAVREEYLARICEELGAAPVQHIGKLLVVFRPAPPDEKSAGKKSGRPAPRRTKRSFQG